MADRIFQEQALLTAGYFPVKIRRQGKIRLTLGDKVQVSVVTLDQSIEIRSRTTPDSGEPNGNGDRITTLKPLEPIALVNADGKHLLVRNAGSKEAVYWVKSGGIG